MNKSFFLVFSILISLLSCKKQDKATPERIYVEVIGDSVVKPYSYFSEVKLNSKANTQKLLKNIQLLSENYKITTSNPENRLREKMQAFRDCTISNTPENCNYTPESYKILSNNYNYLVLQYSYNAYGSTDEYYKYACFNLVNQERITNKSIFTDGISVLNMYNKKYRASLKNYMNDLDTSDEDEQDEYTIIKDHLESGKPFTLGDLDNFELIYENNSLTHIRFHYNGQGGLYKQTFPAGYQEFTVQELKPYTSESFLKELVLN